MADIQKTIGVKEESDSVSKYLKDHPTLLVATISAIVAITSFCMNVCIFYINVRKIQFWGFSKEQLQSVSANQIYIIAAVLFFVAYNIFSYKSLSKSFVIYFTKVEKITTLRKALRVIARDKKRKERISRKQKKQINRQSRKASGKNVTSNIFVELPRIEKQAESLQKTFDGYKPAVRSLRFFSFLQLLPTLILYLLLGIVSFYLFMFALDTAPISKIQLPHAVAFILLLLCVHYLPERLGALFISRKHTRQLAYDTAKLGELMQEVVTEFETPPDYPASKLFNASWMRLPTNRGLSSFAVKYVFIVLVLSVYLIGFLPQQANNSFPIVTSAEGTYVVVYQNGKTYYMEEATLSGKSIIINTNKQRILEAPDLVYEIIEFDTIEIYKNGKPRVS